MKKEYYRREFLNHPGFNGVAAMLARSYDDTDYTLTLSDCNRQITLCFDSFTSEDVENSLYKANLLREELNRIVLHLNRRMKKLRKEKKDE